MAALEAEGEIGVLAGDADLAGVSLSELSDTAFMSDHSHIVLSLVILSAAKDPTSPALPPLRKNADGDSGREVSHFVRDDQRIKTSQRALNERI